MSKQEARLPDVLDLRLKTLMDYALDVRMDWSSFDGRDLLRFVETWDLEMRSAILAALNEARDEALEKAAELIEHPQTSYRRIELADKIRALKSKPNSVDKPSQ